MPSNSYIPATVGFARAACLTAAGTSQVYLAEGDYHDGQIYNYDGTDLINILLPAIPSSLLSLAGIIVLFGEWFYTALGGQLPTNVTRGGLQFFGGTAGGVNWSTTTFLGVGHSLDFQLIAHPGGILGFNPVIPGLGYVATGNEVFQIYVQTNLNPSVDEVLVGFYDAFSGWSHNVYWGNAEYFGITATAKGAFTSGGWNVLTWTAADMGIVAGTIITGIQWGAWAFNSVSSDLTNPTNALFDSIYITSGGSSPVTTISSGYIDAAPDGSLGYYLLSHTQTLIHGAVLGATPIEMPIPDSFSTAYTGMTFNSANNVLYFIRSDGQVYTYNGAVVANISAIPFGHTNPPRRLYTDTFNLFTLLAAESNIGTYNITSANWSFLPSPFDASIDEIYYGTNLFAGGSNYITISDSGMFDAAYAPGPINSALDTTGQLLVTIPGSNEIHVWDFAPGGWVADPVPVLGGSGDPEHIAAAPDGFTALVSNTSANILQVLTYVAGVWNSSDISITSPGSLAVIRNTQLAISQALVCRPDGITVVSKSALTWAVTSTVSDPHGYLVNPTSIAATPDGRHAVVAVAGGVVFLTASASIWDIVTFISLAPTPTKVVSDLVNTANEQFYAMDPATGTVYILANNTMVGHYIVTNNPIDIRVINTQIITPFTSTDLGLSFYQGGLSDQATLIGSIPNGSTILVYIPSPEDFTNLLLIGNDSTLYELFDNGPQTFARTASSVLGSYNGSFWASIDLANRNRVTSITQNVSGNVFVSTVDNQIYQISGTSLVSGYPFLLEPPPGQESGVPSGIDKLVRWPGLTALFSSTPMNGGIIEVQP